MDTKDLEKQIDKLRKEYLIVENFIRIKVLVEWYVKRGFKDKLGHMMYLTGFCTNYNCCKDKYSTDLIVLNSPFWNQLLNKKM